MRATRRLAVLATALTASCSLFVDLSDLTGGPGANGACDGGCSGNDAGDGGTSSETGVGDGGSAPIYAYNDITDLGNWETFDISSYVLDDAGDLPAFVAGAFDGRYVYFAPQRVGYTDALMGLVLRYDTTKTFSDAGSWQSFDTASMLDSHASGFGGIGFDGKYVYLTPAYNSVAVRFDTAGDFMDKAAWSHIDLATLPGAANISGTTAIAAGKYVFFGPSLDYMVRYDTTLPFDQAGSWVGVDEVSLAAAGTYDFGGAAFDGTHILIFPDTGGAPAEALQYDTSRQIGDTAAWSKYDLLQLDGGAFPAFENGAVFDGKYVYGTPNPSAGESIVTRHDPSQPLDTVSSWSQFDLTTNLSISNDDATGAFDGRFVYVVPVSNGNLVRYDTTGTFGDAAAWSNFMMAALPGDATSGFGGSAFDGSYLYLIPRGSQRTYRFHARTPQK